jgi:serine/threonine-protein kinase
MHGSEDFSAAVRNQLERILCSRGFARNDRLSKFLRYVVEQQLDREVPELKESVVGVEVFGRQPGYDPRRDSVVRTEAAKLRARLTGYYGGEGAADPVIIELPKGGYTPVFRERCLEAVCPEPHARRRLWVMPALTALGLIVVLGAWLWIRHKREPVAIAVLPLINLSSEADDEYFADGVTDEIIRNLSIIEGLAVRSATSSFTFKGKPRNLGEIGEQLKAEYIIEGSVLRIGQRVRINVRLVRVRDDVPVWSERFDRELTGVLAVQDDISRGIVNSLRLKLARGRRRYETSAEAYNVYLRARSLQRRLGILGENDSIKLFQHAISKDPSFAPAFAGLAAAHAMRSGQFRFNLDEEVTGMRAAAERAIQLDPLLAEAHAAMALAFARDAQWDRSEESFRRAIELDPSRSATRIDFVFDCLMPIGRLDEAVAQLRRAEQSDPLSPQVHFGLGWVLIVVGRYDEAAKYCQTLPAGYALKDNCLGRARFGQGRIDEAIKIFAAKTGWSDRASLGYVYGRVGRREEAEKLAELAPNASFQSIIFAGLGDKERTLKALHAMTPLGPFRLGRTLTYPEFQFLHGDPRLNALRRKAGLPE